jgi:hypothetical protein
VAGLVRFATNGTIVRLAARKCGLPTLPLIFTRLTDLEQLDLSEGAPRFLRASTS